MPAQNVLFGKQDRLAFGLRRWSLVFVLILCIDQFFRKIFWLLLMKF